MVLFLGCVRNCTVADSCGSGFFKSIYFFKSSCRAVVAEGVWRVDVALFAVYGVAACGWAGRLGISIA